MLQIGRGASSHGGAEGWVRVRRRGPRTVQVSLALSLLFLHLSKAEWSWLSKQEALRKTGVPPATGAGSPGRRFFLDMGVG